MTLKEALKELESLGDAKVRAMHQKNGAGDNLYGVKMGDIRGVAKKIKTDHELGRALWKTGNLEARLLALLVMTPKKLSAAEVEGMVESAKFDWLATWLTNYVVKVHPAKEALRVKWMETEEVWPARAGWSLTAERVAKDPEGLDVEGLLARVERELGGASPVVQWTMNGVLAEIGINFSKLRKRAVGIGEKLGVYRDYPCSKGCTSPFAPIWIAEMVKRKG